MLDEFVALDPELLRAYEEEFKIDFTTHCLSADDAIRLFPYTKLATADVSEMNTKFLARVSHAFPVFNIKRTILHRESFFTTTCTHIGKMLFEDRVVSNQVPNSIELNYIHSVDVHQEQRKLPQQRYGISVTNAASFGL